MTPATILEHDDIKQPIVEWALDYGITPAIIIGRLERGMSIADAIIPMLYDEHWAGSSPGPVASPRWVRHALTLRVREAVGSNPASPTLPV